MSGDTRTPPMDDRTEGFKTTDGTIYVSKPFRSKDSKKLRALITFKPRASVFDTTNESTGANEFRGFFSLFWISMFLFTVRTYVSSIEQNGYALSMAFAHMFSRDAITLAISDAVLVASTGLCVPFAKAISKGWIRYYWIGAIIQHSFQIIVIISAITWTFNRNWPWVQSGFLTLHSIVMVMKVHSYISVNGYLQQVETQSQCVFAELRQLTMEHSGWEEAISAAKSVRNELDNTNTSQDDFTPISTPGETLPDGTTKAFVNPATATALRKRLIAVSPLVDGLVGTPSVEQLKPFPAPSHMPEDNSVSTTTHPLVDHPDERISTLAKEYSELQSELTSPGPNHVRWPNNITWKNFAVYQLIPTLVYELEYPRTDRIRPLYLFEKTVATFGTFALLYTVAESIIIPLTPSSDQSFFRSLLDLALPFMIAYLLLFYIIFECICNGFAELSYFADRQFYEDWWNSTSWDEFSRKWNKPVHTFLLRHVYASTISSYQLSRPSAMFVTFLVSATAHELVMAVVTRKFRLYLFLLQLIQIPLIAISRTPIIKRNKLLGNVVFWLGIYAGLPLLCVAYVAY